jgi:hypothetical protein
MSHMNKPYATLQLLPPPSTYRALYGHPATAAELNPATTASFIITLCQAQPLTDSSAAPFTGTYLLMGCLLSVILLQQPYALCIITPSSAGTHRQLYRSLHGHPLADGVLAEVQRNAGPVRRATLAEGRLEGQLNLLLRQVA